MLRGWILLSELACPVHPSLLGLSRDILDCPPHTKYRSCLNHSASSLFASTNATSEHTATSAVAATPIAVPIAANPRIVKHVYPVKMERYMTRKRRRKRSSDLVFIVPDGGLHLSDDKATVQTSCCCPQRYFGCKARISVFRYEAMFGVGH